MAQRIVPLTYQEVRQQIERGIRNFRCSTFISVFLPNFVSEDVWGLKRGLDLKEVNVREAVDLRCATIRGNLNLDDTVIGGGLDLGGAIIEGNLFLRNAKIGFATNLSQATIKGIVMLGGTTVKGSLSFEGAVIEGEMHLTDCGKGVTIRRNLDLSTKQGPTRIFVSQKQAQLVHWAAPCVPLIVVKYP